MKTFTLIIILIVNQTLSYSQNPCEPEIINLNISNVTNTQFLKTNDNNLIIFGDYIDLPTSQRSTFVRKIKPDGSEIWTQYLPSGNNLSLKKVISLNNGNFIVQTHHNLCEKIISNTKIDPPLEDQKKIDLLNSLIMGYVNLSRQKLINLFQIIKILNL